MKDIRAEVMKIFGDNLSFIRYHKGITRKQLADYLNVDKNTIGAYENAKKLPPIDKIILIANFFEVNVIDLIGDNNGLYKQTAYVQTLIDVEIQKKFSEYRLKKALELTEFDFLCPPVQNADGTITVSIPATFSVDDKGLITHYADSDGAIMHNVTFKNADVFVSTVEKAEQTAAKKFVPFVQEFKSLVSEILRQD